jgi:hypothetical protein
MLKSETIGELAKALAIAQGEIQNAKKDSENPFFKSKYADLAAVREAIQAPFAKNGLAVSQFPRTVFTDDTTIVSIETILTHASGEWLSGELAAIPTKTDPQGIGSCLTYLRRYALSAIAGVASEVDDDGNAASQPAPAKTVQQPKPKTQASTEMSLLKQAAVDTCKLMNEAGAEPSWNPKRLNEISKEKFNAEADHLSLPDMRELVKYLSEQLDDLKVPF